MGNSIQLKKLADVQNGGNRKYEYMGHEVAEKEGYLSDGDPSSNSYGDEDQDDDFSDESPLDNVSPTDHLTQNNPMATLPDQYHN